MWLRSFMLCLFSFALTACEEKLPSPFKASNVTAKYAQADFHLLDAQGKQRNLADYQGKVVAIFFGYTHCPDVCPTALADLAQVLDKLGKDAARVQVIFITLDPERDTPQILAQYPPAFHPSFIGLYGDAEATSQAAKAFGVVYQKQTSKNGGYTLDHSAGIYFIGSSGKPRLLAPYGQRVDWMESDVKLLLALR
jgi:protein SCO1/2